MTDEIEIEAGIEKVAAHRKAKYPFEKMAPGHSFIIPVKSMSSAFTAASGATKKFKPKKFSAGKDDKGNIRIWRDE